MRSLNEYTKSFICSSWFCSKAELPAFLQDTPLHGMRKAAAAGIAWDTAASLTAASFKPAPYTHVHDGAELL